MLKVSLKVVTIVFSIIAIVISCAQPDKCKNYNYYSQFNYDINTTKITNGGIKVDVSSNTIDLSEIDKLTDETELCLIQEFGNPPVISKEVMKQSGCLHNTFAIPFPRECMTVKIVDDWVWSCDGTQQLIPQEAPQELCDAKGLSYNSNCPCRWRAGIQDNHIIVVTPNLFLYKDPLIRLMTGCNNPWAHPKVSKCAHK